MFLADTTSHPLNSTFSMVWFTLPFINAGLAQSKGRSRLNWWLISLLLGPIATAVVVLMDPLEEED